MASQACCLPSPAHQHRIITLADEQLTSPDTGVAWKASQELLSVKQMMRDAILVSPSAAAHHVLRMRIAAGMTHHEGGNAASDVHTLCAGVLSQTLAKPKDLPTSIPAQEALANPCSELFGRCPHASTDHCLCSFRAFCTVSPTL